MSGRFYSSISFSVIFMVALSLMYISVTTKKQSFSMKDKSYDFSLKVAVNCDKKIIFLTCYFNN